MSGAPHPLTDHPLSPAQEAVHFVHRLAADGTLNLPTAVRLCGPLDLEALRAAIRQIGRRHEILRTVFVAAEGRTVQRVLPEGGVALPLIDLSGLPEEERGARLQRALAARIGAPFRLEEAPPWSAELFREQADRHVLLLNFHHIVWDGWSIGVFSRELTALYAAFRDQRPIDLPLPAQFHRFSDHQRLLLQQSAPLERWWRAQLQGVPAAELPGRPRPATATFNGAMREIAFPPEIVARIERLQRTRQQSAFPVLLALFAWLLRQEGAPPMFCVGTPFANRQDRAFDTVIGPIANILVLPLDLRAPESFWALVQGCRARASDAFDRAALPYERVVECVDAPRDPARNPLFQIMFALHQESMADTALAGLTVEPVAVEADRTHFDLGLHLWRRPGQIKGYLAFNSDLYTPEQIGALCERLLRIADDLTGAPDAPLPPVDPPGQIPAPGAEKALQALRLLPQVAEAHVGRDPSGVLCAWAVPQSPERAPDLAAERTIEEACGLPVCLVDRLPRTRWGAVDQPALERLPWIDGGLLQRAAAIAAPLGARAVLQLRQPDQALLPLAPMLPALPEPPPKPAPPAWARGPELRPVPGVPDTLTAAFLMRAAASEADPGAGQVWLVEADGSEGPLPLAALRGAAAAVQEGLRAYGARAGQPVLIQSGSMRAFFVAFWGAVLQGMIPVTVASPAEFSPAHPLIAKLWNAWLLLERPLLLCPQDQLSPLRACAPPEARLLSIDALLADGRRITEDPVWTPDFHRPDPGDVLFYQLTSGSTGTPKIIPELHRAVLQHVHSVAQHNGYSSSDTDLNWIPLDHVMSLLTSHLRDIALGIPQIQMHPSVVLADPLRWLDRIQRHRATLTAAPNFLFKLVNDALAQNDRLADPAGGQPTGRRSWDLSSLRYFLNGGEQVTMPVVREFLTRLGAFGLRTEAMQPAFGMAEAATGVAYQQAFSLDSADGGSGFMDLGPPVPGVEIRIADDDGTTLPEGRIGRMLLRGPSVMPGYHANPEANAACMLADGWFDTGDLGFLRAGRLTVTGRAKETIIVRGNNLYCYELEAVIGAIPGVANTWAGVCAVPDPAAGTEGVAVFYVPAPDRPLIDPPTLRAIRARITQDFGVIPAHILPMRQEEFPRTSSGKIQRGELSRRLQSGALHATGSRVQEILAAGLPAGRAAGLPAGAVPPWFHRLCRVDVLPAPRASGQDAGLAGWRLCRARELLAGGLLAGGLLAGGLLAGGLSACPDRGEDLIVYGDLAPEEALIALQRIGAGRRRLLWLVCGAEPPALRVVLECAAAEVPGLRARLVAVEAEEPAGGEADPWQRPALREILSAEMADAGPASAACWRAEGGRMIRQEYRLERHLPAPRGLPWSPGDAVLLTGGAGGVGLALAAELARCGARPFLVGRTIPTGPLPFPFLSGDVRDPIRMAQIVAEIKAEIGAPARLAGALHLAGSFPVRLLREETPAGMQELIAVKAGGLEVLDGLLERDAFLVGASSVFGIFGGAGGTAYAAANAEVQRRCAQRRARGAPTWSVAWSRWERTGLSAPGPGLEAQAGDALAARYAERGFTSMPAAHAARSTLAVLAAEPDDWIIGLDDRRPMIARISAGAPATCAEPVLLLDRTGGLHDLPPLTDRLQRPCPLRLQSGGDRSGGAAEQAPVLPQTQLERVIAAVWSEVLGVSPVDIDRSFFELGGQSVLLVQVLARLETALALKIPITELFRYPTVRALAAHLARQRGPEAGAPRVDPARQDRARDRAAKAREALQLRAPRRS